MSPNPYPLFSLSQHDNPERIKIKIRMLIQLYLKDPCPFIADAVVKHITTLLAAPKYINDAGQRCQYRKLELHWRYLAWIGETEKKKKITVKFERFRLECNKTALNSREL